MYDQFASDYDRFVNWQNRLSLEIPFIEKVIRESRVRTDKPFHVLDVACGTGMHAIRLSEDGFAVSGADLSPQMIAAARKNAQEAKQSLRFEAMGFGALSETFGHGNFDALLCLGNSLPHLLSEADLHAALLDFADCLKPGGLLLIQNRNFDAVMQKHERWMEPQVFEEGEREWIFQRFYDFNTDGTIRFNIVNLKKLGDGAWQPEVLSTLLRPILSLQLCALLEQAGFINIQLFGSLSDEPFNPLSSGNSIILAKKIEISPS